MSTLKNEVNDLSSKVASMLASVRKTKKNTVAYNNATPRIEMQNNPWKLTGILLVETEIQCQRCKTVHTTPHGLMEVYRHEKKNETWEIPLLYTGNSIPDEQYLGKQTLGRSTVNGCQACIAHITETNP